MKKEIVIKNRHFGKTFMMIRQLEDNPRQVCVCSENRKKQLQKQFPYMKDRFKTMKELMKPAPASPKFSGV